MASLVPELGTVKLTILSIGELSWAALPVQPVYLGAAFEKDGLPKRDVAAAVGRKQVRRAFWAVAAWFLPIASTWRGAAASPVTDPLPRALLRRQIRLASRTNRVPGKQPHAPHG